MAMKFKQWFRKSLTFGLAGCICLVSVLGGTAGKAAAEEAALQTFIIDNDTNGTKDGFPVSTAGFGQTGFSYAATSTVNGYAGKSHFTSAGTPEAKWTPAYSGQPFGIGTYRVSIFIPKRPAAYGIASVEVYRDGSSDVRQINLAGIANPSGEWVELGVYDFMGGANLEYVRLTRDASSPASTFVHADAVKFERLSSRITDLSSLLLGSTPIWEADRTAYANIVPGATQSVTVTPTALDPEAAVSVNGLLSAGSSPVSIALAQGSNTVEIVVTAQNASFEKTYTLTIIRPASSSSNTALEDLEINGAPVLLTPSGQIGHRVDGDTDSVQLTIAPEEPEAFVTIGGTYVPNGTASEPIHVNEGSNTIEVKIIAPDAATVRVYTVNLYRERTDATLAGLHAGTVSLVTPTADPSAPPVFDPAVQVYSYEAPAGASSVTFQPTASDPNAEIYVNGELVGSGSASSPIPLSSGVQAIPILVKAEDRSYTAAYTVYAGAGDYAAGKPVTASQSYLFAPAVQAADGSGSTVWRNLSFDAHPYVWLEADLGDRQTFNQAVLNIYNSADASRFKLQTSDDGQQWNDIYVKSSTPETLEIVDFAPVTARYVRYYAEKARASAYTGLYSMEIYGADQPSGSFAGNYERLADLNVSSGTLTFDPYERRYVVVADTDVTITAVKADPGQTVTMNGTAANTLTVNRTSMPETAAIGVTSQDGTRTIEYEISLELPPMAAGSGFTLAFADEFEGSAVNEQEWYYRYGVSGHSDNRKENLTVSEGKLHINLKKQPSGGAEYTAGGVISKRELGYGYYETRAKLWGEPGFHTSFWQAGLNERVAVLDGNTVVYGTVDNQVNEIDGFEIDSHDPGVVRTAGHHWYPGDAHVVFGTYDEYRGINSADGYHVYGYEWTPTHVKFYVDGELTRIMTYPGRTPMGKMYG